MSIIFVGAYKYTANSQEKSRFFTKVRQTPSNEERNIIRVIHTEDFYGEHDPRLQERFYKLHLICASNNNFRPPILNITENGQLSIKEDRYYTYKNHEKTHDLNPFSKDDFQRIKSAVQRGLDIDYEWKLENHAALFQNCLPELTAILFQAMHSAEEEYEECA